MALVQKCLKCGRPVHYLMPWMKNCRKIKNGKHKGQWAHKDCKKPVE